MPESGSSHLTVWPPFGLALRLATPVWLLLICLLCAACSTPGCSDDKGGKPAASAAPKPPAPAPPDLLAELTIAQPRQLLTEVRDAAGGPAAVLLPRTLGVLIANALSYPIRSAELFDEQLPIVAAVTGSDKSDPAWAIAIHVRKRQELLLLLTGGAQPGHLRKPAGEATCLPPKEPQGPPGASESTPRPLGCLLDHYLLITSSAAAAEHIGPYAVRTLAARKPPRNGDVLLDTQPGALSRWLPKQLTKLRAGLSEGDLPARMRSLIDTEALLADAQTLSQETGRAELTLQLNRKAWTARGTLYPADDAAGQRWKQRGTIDPSALGKLPDDTVAAASWSQPEDSRVRQAGEQAALVTAGESFTEDDRQALQQALRALARARSDRTLLGLRCTGVGLTGYAESGARDGDKLAAALDELLAFTGRDTVGEQLKQRELTLSHRKLRMLKVPADITLLRLQPTRPEGKPPMPADTLSAIDLRYGVAGSRLLAAAGYETVETLKMLYGPDSERSLGAKPTVARALEGLTTPAWLLAFADPQGIHACQSGKPGGSFATPLVLRLGPDEKHNAALQLYFARELVRVLVRELGK